MKQMKLFNEKQSLEFGGSLLRGRRKSRRPLAVKRPLHLVLKAGDSSRLLRNKGVIQPTLHHYARRFGIRIYALAVHADHIHLSVKISEAAAYRRWIRAATSRLVTLIAGLKWSLRPYSRVGAWGRAFRALQSYIVFNHHEGEFILRAHEAVQRWLEESVGQVVLLKIR